MTDIRQFIKNLGDNAPAFFDTKKETVARWLKTGSVPFKAIDKINMAMDAANASKPDVPEPSLTPVPAKELVEAGIDPVTHLPTDIDRRLPQIQAAPGHAPQVVEMNPVEQNWGVNLTRPGRVSAPMPPMKIRKVNGQNVPYVEQPEPVKVLPPEIDGSAGWNKPIEKPNEPTVKEKSPEGVSQKTV